jgi:mRNA interferase HicA
MKRGSLLRHLRKYGCYLKREGREHSLWTNPKTGEVEAVPRHVEISNKLARKICRLSLHPRDLTLTILGLDPIIHSRSIALLPAIDARHSRASKPVQ